MTRAGVPPSALPSATTPRVVISTTDRALAVVGAILDEGGEASLRMADVSSRSGISVGSLYHHFGSRKGMVTAARERQFLESLPDDAVGKVKLLQSSSTPAEFVERIGVELSETPSRSAEQRRRFEIIGIAARLPAEFGGVLAMQTSYLDACEDLAQGLKGRGWLREGIEPRAFALLILAISMSNVMREVDLHPVAADAWDKLVEMCLGCLVVG